MPDFFTTPTVQAGVAVLILCVLIAAAFYLMSIFRDYAADDQETAADQLLKLEEMHRKGDISEEEFRTIQATTHRQRLGPNAIDDSTTLEDSSPNTQS
jgi:uncharacterized membrane protein